MGALVTAFGVGGLTYGCELHETTAVVLGAATPTPVPFTDADVRDIYDWHDPAGGEPENVVPTEGGLFMVYAEVTFGAAAADIDTIEVDVNDVAVTAPVIANQNAAGNAQAITITVPVVLTAGQDVSIVATSSTGGATAITDARLNVWKIAAMGA